MHKCAVFYRLDMTLLRTRAIQISCLLQQQLQVHWPHFLFKASSETMRFIISRWSADKINAAGSRSGNCC